MMSLGSYGGKGQEGGPERPRLDAVFAGKVYRVARLH